MPSVDAGTAAHHARRVSMNHDGYSEVHLNIPASDSPARESLLNSRFR